MDQPKDAKQRLAEIDTELSALDDRRSQLLEELNSLQQQISAPRLAEPPSSPAATSLVTNQSPQEDKIHLFRALFRGREDVFPRRFESTKTGKSGYQPVCYNEWARGVCQKPKIACAECGAREFVPLSDEVIRNHLRGFDPQSRSKKDFTIGVYPLLPDERCWFLAVDFDKSTWAEDAKAYLETCASFSIPAALERSRSGNGGHVWIFFDAPVSAGLARKLGALLLTHTMNSRPEIGLDSYDRFFPSQDTLPRGGFGNLIALPLQKKPREQNNSVFVDRKLNPYADQWAFLASIHIIPAAEVERIVLQAEREGEITGVRAVVLDEMEHEPWKLAPSRRYQETPLIGPMPDHLQLVIANQIFIDKDELPPSLRNRIVRLAAFQNPAFYKAQAMRLSTYGKPRIISCCEDYPKHLGIPRGCLGELSQLLRDLKIKVEIRDERFPGNPIDVAFHGSLRPEQQRAADQLVKTDLGVLSASTAFGKTVIGAWLVAQRKVNTLVVVHRRQLMDQWMESLSTFLGLEQKEIGQVGGGKYKATGVIDVAMIQSLIKKGMVDDLVGNYGQVIVDECHHISAASFEQVIRAAKAKYITGLSATVTRQDGHHPIIFMQCGPVRYRVDDRQGAASRAFTHTVLVRRTNFQLPIQPEEGQPMGIQELYAWLAANYERNQMILSDVLEAIRCGRSPVLLTERREHLAHFAEWLTGEVKNVVVLSGGMGRKQRAEVMERLKAIPEEEERLILATGRYLGEGFDDARLDTLFLALPISWRGTVAQYAGRLHRNYERKKEVVIYDYVDDLVPMLANMFTRRRKGYRAIGYEVSE